MKIILTGGGTGGHVYPALAIADFYKRKNTNAEFLYLGTKKRLEAYIVPGKGYKIKFISAVGMPANKLSFKFFIFFILLLSGVLKSAFHIFTYRPKLVIATGGFVSAPVVMAAFLLRKVKLYKGKIFLHEANAEAGKMVNLCSKMADGVGVAYLSALDNFTNSRFVGYPVRETFYQGSKQESRSKLGITDDEMLVLSVGGSQGARNINSVLIESLPHITREKKIKLFHVVGKGSVEYNPQKEISDLCLQKEINLENYPFYKQFDYLDNVTDYLYAADLIISRGGAGFLSEIPFTETPAIIIPKANLSGDHQVVNAEQLKSLGAAEVVYEQAMFRSTSNKVYVNSKEFVNILNYLILNPRKLELMREAQRKIKELSFGGDEIVSFIEDVLNQKPEQVRKISEKKNSAATQILKKSMITNPFAKLSGASIVTKLETLERLGKSSEIEANKQYLKYRASHYLISANWKICNYGIKISGLLKDQDSLKLLSSFLNDKKKAPLLHRFISGDYHTPGFLRRNIIMAYRRINRFNNLVQQDLLQALDDPYYEVVAESLKTLTLVEIPKEGNDIISKIQTILINRNEFDIKLEGLNAYFKILAKTNHTENEIIKHIEFLRPYFSHSNYLHREAIINGLSLLVTANLISIEKALKFKKRIIISQNGFSPQFSLKSSLNKLIKASKVNSKDK